MRLPRWWHRLYAASMGYFWLPCPICGRPFGGHERDTDDYLMTDGYGNGKGVCPDCGPRAWALNDQWFSAYSVWEDTDGSVVLALGEKLPESDDDGRAVGRGARFRQKFRSTREMAWHLMYESQPDKRATFRFATRGSDRVADADTDYQPAISGEDCWDVGRRAWNTAR